MKTLYGYSFKNRKLESAVVEVEEKPKTYRVPHGSFPLCYLSIVKKEDIGAFVGYSGLTVFYTEPSKDKAIQKFKEKFNRDLESKKHDVAILEEKIRILESEGK